MEEQAIKKILSELNPSQLKKLWDLRERYEKGEFRVNPEELDK